jgi:RNA polymerase-binding transcription factor DksA
MHNHNHNKKKDISAKDVVYQKALLDEQERLIDSMSFLGHMQNEVTGDWTVAPAEEIDTMREFDSSSDRVEETLTNESILETLEERLKEISLALEKIEKDQYGKCEKCDKNIEDDKLKANPATKYCMDCEIK